MSAQCPSPSMKGMIGLVGTLSEASALTVIFWPPSGTVTSAGTWDGLRRGQSGILAAVLKGVPGEIDCLRGCQRQTAHRPRHDPAPSLRPAASPGPWPAAPTRRALGEPAQHPGPATRPGLLASANTAPPGPHRGRRGEPCHQCQGRLQQAAGQAHPGQAGRTGRRDEGAASRHRCRLSQMG